jgi:hypothetical protein
LTKNLKYYTLAAAAFFSMSPASKASPLVYGSLVPTTSWTDSRQAPVNSGSDNGLVGNGNWSDIAVSWSITQTGSVFHYEYTFSGLSGKNLSHFILDLSDNCVSSCDHSTSNGSCVYNADYDVAGTPNLEYGTFGPASGNPGFPTGGSITGVKFDSWPDGLSAIEFDSSRAPMWGDFYAKGGKVIGTNTFNYAYNQGLANHSTYNDAKFFIAVPDTVGSTVPEPGSLMLIASGGLLLVLGAWRRARG